MTFADKYANHAYADLIREAETQGIGLGVQAERKRIIEFLKDKCECTERMLADAWSPQGQTLFCKWHKLIHEIKGDDK